MFLRDRLVLYPIVSLIFSMLILVGCKKQDAATTPPTSGSETSASEEAVEEAAEEAPTDEGTEESSDETAEGEEVSKATSKLQVARAELTAAKDALRQTHQYHCCIEPGCDFCLISMEECPCGHNLADGKPVCGECLGGWHGGVGEEHEYEGVEADNVQLASDQMMEMMYSERQRQYGE